MILVVASVRLRRLLIQPKALKCLRHEGTIASRNNGFDLTMPFSVIEPSPWTSRKPT